MTQNHNIFKLYHGGDHLFEDLILKIKAAKKSIYIEMYIFTYDEATQPIWQALFDACSRGVLVKVLVDAMGSREITKHKRALIKSKGVLFKRYHIYTWLNPFSKKLNKRDHRKIIVIDDQFAFVGGMNLHNKESKTYQNNPIWQDTHALICGPLAFKAAYYFLRQFHHFYLKKKKFEKAWYPNDLITSGQYFKRNKFKRTLIHQIKTAQNQIRLTTAYFVPDFETVFHLLRAQKRGVTIQIITNSIHKSDVPLVSRIHQPILKLLIPKGIQVYYHKTKMIHSKTTLFDNNLATLGTSNLNYRSFYKDLEINLICREPAVIENINETFETNLLDCHRVQITDIKNKPIFEKIVDRFFYLLRSYF